jgi:hypothetical protein
MNESAQRLQHFTGRLLTHEGALAAVLPAGGLEVLAPPRVQQALGLEEITQLAFDGAGAAGAARVGLEGDWLERCAELLGARGRHTRLTWHAPLPSLGDPEKTLQNALDLQNAVYRYVKTEAAWTRYWLLLLRYTAISDEKREGLVALCLNVQNGSVTDALAETLLAGVLAPGAALEARLPPGVVAPAAWPAQRVQQMLRRALPERVRAALAQFTAGMERRLARDLARLHDYYNGLRAEAWAHLQKQKGDAARERLRLDTAEREYRLKVADARQKYALSVGLEWSQTLEIVMPVQRVQALLKRRKAERRLALDWNPAARRLDAPPDEWSFASTPARVVCDAASHLLSPAGHGPCASCGKEYCRVCHARRCPKCGAETPE